MNANLPIPSSWQLYLAELYRKGYRQVTSPWTKLAFLALLAIIATREESSFTISLNGGGFLDLTTASIFDADHNESENLARFAAANGDWTPQQQQQLAYVNQYGGIARDQMRSNGIPASITLAQGLLESGTGGSTLATRNNNHFGIKCFSTRCKKGHCSNHSDDSHKDFFRIYKNPEESYLAHGKFLQQERYRKLFDLRKNDYRGWAKELSRAGYATDPRYADKLIRLIESLQLHRYDNRD